MRMTFEVLRVLLILNYRVEGFVPMETFTHCILKIICIPKKELSLRNNSKRGRNNI